MWKVGLCLPEDGGFCFRIRTNFSAQLSPMLSNTCYGMNPTFLKLTLNPYKRGHGGAVVTHLTPTCEVGGSNPEPYVGKLVVSY